MKLQKIYNDIIKAYFEDNYNSRFAFEENGNKEITGIDVGEGKENEK